MYDLIIIGSGPAGMTAAIYAARREMKTLIIGKELGGQVIWASEIENYPGFKSISNYDLISKMSEQVKALGVEIKTDEVQKIEKNEDGNFSLFTSKDKLEAKTVLLAIGLSPRRLAIPGEQEFSGKGVSYCANCDGPFYKNKNVAVVGGGNSALDAAEVLSKIAKQVYLIHRRDEFRGFEALLDEVKNKTNIELLLNSEIKEITGANKVEKIKVLNIQTQTEREVAVDGVFIEVGRIASTDIIADLAERDEKNQILVDEKFMTKTPGLFAAGDVVRGEFKQITIACGQATIAALAAYQYLQLKQGKSGMVFDRAKH
ncbi:MAG: thioredoxin-disulfide reductase [Patescibacteria group bacterium]|nr:thioredoxin-disulfide reductase [Patescibacteria group bacterium]MDD4610640.1 thioredoxin-disulfide reductase [Patescibacteria group bacterium]